jgi:soluble lytic murein transglycosylase-like protein
VPALVARLAVANQLNDPDVLIEGQTLDLPPDLAVHARPVRAQNTAAREAGFSVRTYGRAIVATARRLQVDPVLSLAVARAESGVSAAMAKETVLDPRAVSQDGKSVGLFQLTSETGKAQLKALALRQTYNPFNPQQNIRLGVGYLKYLSEVFSKETILLQDLRTTPGADSYEVHRLAVAAYNAGEGRVARAQGQARSRGALLRFVY